MIKWDDKLWLFTIGEYNQLPAGTMLTSINGHTCPKEDADLDTRGNYIAYGVTDIGNHELKELFTIFQLKA